MPNWKVFSARNYTIIILRLSKVCMKMCMYPLAVICFELVLQSCSTQQISGNSTQTK